MADRMTNDNTVGDQSRIAILCDKLSNDRALSREEVLVIYLELMSSGGQTPDSESVKNILVAGLTALSRTGQFAEFHRGAKRLLEMCEKTGDVSLKARTLNLVSKVYWQQGDLERSLSSARKSLKLYESLNDEGNIASLVGNIGILYMEFDDPESGLKAFTRAVELSRKLGKTRTVALNLNNMGIVLAKLGDSGRAIECFVESLNMKRELGLKEEVINNLLNIGDMYLDMKEEDKAREYLLEAEAGLKGCNDASLLLETYDKLGRFYGVVGEKELAVSYLKKAFELAAEMGAKRVLSRLSENLMDVCEGCGDLVQALYYSKECNRLQREIFNENSAKRIAELRAQFEKELRLKEAELERKALTEQNNDLRAQVLKDSLTGLRNRLRMYDELEAVIMNARNRGTPLTLSMVDIDDFKLINDANGHQTGDELLQKIGVIIRGSLRESDLAYRYGGEEFMIVLPATDIRGGTKVIERIRRAVQDMGKVYTPSVTVSAGVAQWKGENDFEFIHEADRLLYLAKSKGKNCMEVG